MQVLILCELGLKTPIHAPKINCFGGLKNRGMVVRCWPNELVLTFGSCYLYATFGENRWRNATVRVQTDRQTDGHTHWQRQTGFIICPVLYAIAMGQITRFFYKKKTVLLFQPVYAVVYKCTLKLCLFYCRSTVLYIWSYRFACTSLPAIKRGLSFYGYLIITTLPR